MPNKSDESYGHVLKYTGIFGGVQGLNILISLVRNKIVAKLLGPGGMGLTALFNSSVNFISQSTNLGISFSAVRHVSELFEQGDERKLEHYIKVVRVWSLLTALLGMFVCIVAGPLFSKYTFSWGDHTLHFVMLSPAVALLAITGGETAILKGVRRLKSLAAIQIYSVFMALVVSVPLFYFFNQTAIVPVIVLMALISMLLTIRYSYKLYPLRLSGWRNILGEGMEMVRLGVAFVMAGIFGSGADMLIRSYLNVTSDLDMVGFYNVGFIMTMTYGGMVFSAMETDYFPRLSAAGADIPHCNLMVNRQIEISLLIISPMLVAMLFFTPILIPLLFTSDFLPVVDMMRLTTLALYLRAIKLPISYMTLARGDSLSYMLMEILYDACMVSFVLLGFRYLGLEGTGLGLLFAAVFDFFMLTAYTGFKYHFRLTRSIAIYAVPQILLGCLGYVAVRTLTGMTYWAVGALIFALSLSFSLYVIRRKTSLWDKLAQRIKQQFNRHA